MSVNFLASENWCGRVHFDGHSPEWRVLSKFGVQSWANSRLMDVTQLALTWVGGPNDEKLALTWVGGPNGEKLALTWVGGPKGEKLALTCVQI